MPSHAVLFPSFFSSPNNVKRFGLRVSMRVVVHVDKENSHLLLRYPQEESGARTSTAQIAIENEE